MSHQTIPTKSEYCYPCYIAGGEGHAPKEFITMFSNLKDATAWFDSMNKKMRDENTLSMDNHPWYEEMRIEEY